MDEETRKKIEETVKDILSNADLEQMTEFELRVAVSERLGIDLSDFNHKKFIRDMVESFLLSTVEENGNGKESSQKLPEGEAKATAKIKKELDGDDYHLICKLADMRNVVIHDFRGKTYVSIRDFYVKDGKELPSASGVTLSSEIWSNLKNNFAAIDEAITKMQSKLSVHVDGEKNEDVSTSVAASSNEFSSIEVTRFDGKNYHYWAEQMEHFLKQLRIAYVLHDPCPRVTLSPKTSAEESAQVKAAQMKWMNDDYLCRHSILSSLSDNLYYQFSMKTKTAKELWEELKLVYLYEEFGTKRSQVRKYIEFQFIEERSIVEQMQELNCIADSIVAAGMMIEENFHVSVIISKLPPSWKDFSIKMMREEYLPFWILMNNVKVEEESRNRAKQAEHSTSTNFHSANNIGPELTDTRQPRATWKKRDSEMNRRRQHRNRHFENEVNRKQNAESSTVHAVSNVESNV